MSERFGADRVVHLITVVFIGAVLWMLQSVVASMQADRLVLIDMVDRLAALEVKVQGCDG